jgi:Secretion system C-terminal sorting domain
MKKLLLSLAMAGAAYIAGAQQTYNFNWAKTILDNNTAPTAINLKFKSSALDASLNLYTTGNFKRTIDFNPSATVNNFTANASSTKGDIYLNKLDASGNYVWNKQFTSVSAKVGQVIVDGLGNVIICGEFNGVIDCDPSAAVFNLTPAGVSGSTGSDNFFIIKLDATGNFLWAKQLAGIAKTTTAFYDTDLGIDASNNIYIASSFTSTMDFDPSSAVFNLTSLSAYPATFVTKLNGSGNFQWAKSLGNTTANVNNDIAFTVDASSNVVLTGSFTGTKDFDPSSNVFNLTCPSSGPSNCQYVLKLDNSGNFVSAFYFEIDLLRVDIKTDLLNNIYLSCSSAGGDFDPGSGVNFVSGTGGEDGCIVKLSSSGSFLWVAQFTGASANFVNNLTFDNNNNVYACHIFNGTVDFDPSTTCTRNLSSPSVTSIGIVKLASNGGYLWSGQIIHGQFNDQSCRILATNSVLYIVGNYTGYPDLNPTSGTFTAPGGGYQMFFSKLTLCTSNCPILVDPCTPPNRMALGIADAAILDNNLSLFPNPSNGAFTLDLGKEYKQANVRITNVTGKVLAEYQYKDAQKTALQFDGAPGFYWLDITTEEGKLPRMKLMKE